MEESFKDSREEINEINLAQNNDCNTMRLLHFFLSNIIKPIKSHQEHLGKLDEFVSRRWNSTWKELRLGFIYFLSRLKIFGRISVRDVLSKNERDCLKISNVDTWKFLDVVLVSSKTLFLMFWIKSRVAC